MATVTDTPQDKRAEALKEWAKDCGYRAIEVIISIAKMAVCTWKEEFGFFAKVVIFPALALVLGMANLVGLQEIVGTIVVAMIMAMLFWMGLKQSSGLNEDLQHAIALAALCVIGIGFFPIAVWWWPGLESNWLLDIFMNIAVFIAVIAIDMSSQKIHALLAPIREQAKKDATRQIANNNWLADKEEQQKAANQRRAQALLDKQAAEALQAEQDKKDAAEAAEKQRQTIDAAAALKLQQAEEASKQPKQEAAPASVSPTISRDEAPALVERKPLGLPPLPTFNADGRLEVPASDKPKPVEKAQEPKPAQQKQAPDSQKQDTSQPVSFDLTKLDVPMLKAIVKAEALETLDKIAEVTKGGGKAIWNGLAGKDLTDAELSRLSAPKGGTLLKQLQISAQENAEHCFAAVVARFKAGNK